MRRSFLGKYSTEELIYDLQFLSERHTIEDYTSLYSLLFEMVEKL